MFEITDDSDMAIVARGLPKSAQAALVKMEKGIADLTRRLDDMDARLCGDDGQGAFVKRLEEIEAITKSWAKK
jgi:hypothetical protein